MKDINEFKCSICGKSHKIITLLEFPQPDILGDITRGDSTQNMLSLAKNIICIGKSYVLVQSELSINILDHEDQLDIYTWIEVETEEFRSMLKNLETTSFFKVNGILNRQIPFYKNTKQMSVEISVPIDTKNTPTVSKINRKSQLETDFTNGITIQNLKNFLEKCYHVN